MVLLMAEGRVFSAVINENSTADVGKVPIIKIPPIALHAICCFEPGDHIDSYTAIGSRAPSDRYIAITCVSEREVRCSFQLQVLADDF
jgi:hypothetical protein